MDLFYSSKSTLKKYNICSVPSLNRELSSIIRLGKDKTVKWETPGAVYKFDCQKCDARYIGESKRPLSVRIKEHSDMKNKNTVVSEHVLNDSHSFDWDNTKILDR